MKQPRFQYDFIAIGGGSAGFNAARVTAALGRRVAVVDGARELGGLCILRGCMPSKTLLYMAEVLHLAQKGKTFGLRILSARADMKAIHARKRRLIADFARYRDQALKSGKFDLVRSNARFVAMGVCRNRDLCINRDVSAGRQHRQLTTAGTEGRHARARCRTRARHR